eukprot:283956-Prymnesium_polylepis.2
MLSPTVTRPGNSPTARKAQASTRHRLSARGPLTRSDLVWTEQHDTFLHYRYGAICQPLVGEAEGAFALPDPPPRHNSANASPKRQPAHTRGTKHKRLG